MGQDLCRSWRGREVRVATYQGKTHGGKSVLGVDVVRGEFDEISRGEITRSYCSYCQLSAALSDAVCVCLCATAGPPGTGKTSLCIALAQKLSIVLQDRYNYIQLVEINSHSLFSKWFSEVDHLL